MENSEMT